MNLTLLRPVQGGRVSQWFGGNPAMYVRFGLPGHNGIDYAVPVGTPVTAAHDGWLEVPPVDPDGYGRYVIVRGQGLYTLYAHLSDVPGLQPGAFVHAGNRIGYSGTTGNSTGPHLHFGLRLTKQDYQSQPISRLARPVAVQELDHARLAL